VALPALARGRQVVVVGDSRCASGSAIGELARVLPTVPLHAAASRRDPYLTAFLAAHGYAGVLSPTPLPAGAAAVGHHLVDGRGMPDDTGTVPSTRADVDRVVELVIEHALTRPEESLAVVTGSPLHTAQVREAVLSQVRESPALAACLDGSRPEPFVVTDLTNVAGLRRDALVLSLGLGKTPHGRVLHKFGPVSDPGGAALLLAALGVTRHRLDVVSSIGADEIDPARLRGPGPRLLADLLRFADRRAQGQTERAIEPVVPEDEAATTEAPAEGADVAAAVPDRLVVDLAERLWRHGLVVELDHGLPGGLHQPMAVGHPELPGELLVAVLTDDAAYVDEPSVRVRDRQVAKRLERLGWTVLRVWSAAAFLDPEAEVDRIRRALHAVADRRLADARAERERGRLLIPTLDDPVVAPTTQMMATIGLPGDVGLPAGGGAPDPAPAPVAEPAPVGPPPGSAAAIPGVMEAAAPMTGAMQVVQPMLPVPGTPRPAVRAGMPISAYSDDQVDEIVVWLRSDGAERTDAELVAAVRRELGFTRRSARVDAVVRTAVERALGRPLG
jgi:hypothetical protein